MLITFMKSEKIMEDGIGITEEQLIRQLRVQSAEERKARPIDN